MGVVRAVRRGAVDCRSSGGGAGYPGAWLQLALVTIKSATVVGDCSIHFRGDDPRQVELGITLAPTHQRRGLAAEALGSILEYVFRRLGKHRVSAITDAENHAAAGLLRRLGFRQEAHYIEHMWFNGAWGSEYLFALLCREWQARRKIVEPNNPTRFSVARRFRMSKYALTFLAGSLLAAAAAPARAGDTVDPTLKQAFTDMEVNNAAIKVELCGQRLLLAASAVVVDPDGRIRLTDCALVRFGKGADPSKPWRATTVRGEYIVFTLDRPIRSVTNLGSRKILSAEVAGGLRVTFDE